MNKKQAQAAGYQFTGIYERDKGVAEEEAAQERKLGNKAIVVYEPSNRYSRGYGTSGYSVYVIKSEANKESEKRQWAQNKINSLLSERNKHIAEIEKIDAELKKLDYI